jgi:hypothetical protein
MCLHFPDLLILFAICSLRPCYVCAWRVKNVFLEEQDGWESFGRTGAGATAPSENPKTFVLT